MNGIYALALLLALQVSVGLCSPPSPEPELVEKYEGLKSIFYRRLLTAYGKLQAAAAPLVERTGDGGHSQTVRDFIEDLQTKKEFQEAVKVVSGLAEEAGPVVEKVRLAGLGVYGYYLRPYVGTYLDQGITHLKVYLDKYLPVE